MSDVLFLCDRCDGRVRISRGTCRFVLGEELPVDFETAMCTECGEIYLTTEEALALGHKKARIIVVPVKEESK